MITYILPEAVESYRDRTWRREAELRVIDVAGAERLIEEVGFCSAMTDSRRPGPSLYIAVCGRRDAHMPRNVQKDPESNLTWHLKDEVMRRGRFFYSKLVRGRSTFVAPKLIPYFNALWGVSRRHESQVLSADAKAILKFLRREWEMGTADLRESAKIEDRARFARAIDELQRVMKIVPGDVVYEPRFSYIWTLAEGRFPRELSTKATRDVALREVARAFLLGAGTTVRGELSQVTGLSRPEAGRGNHALVAEGFAERISDGVYRLTGNISAVNWRV